MRKLILCLAMLVAFSGVASASVDVWVSDVEGPPGTTISVPMNVANIGDYSILGYRIDLNYDTTMVNFLSLSWNTAQFPDSDWQYNYNEVSDGLVRVWVYGLETELVDVGSLFTMSYRVLNSAPLGECFDFEFTDVTFNDGSIPVTADGGTFCTPDPQLAYVEGHVSYFTNNEYCGTNGAPDVLVTLKNRVSPFNVLATTFTDEHGYYSFTLTGPHFYRLVVMVDRTYSGNDLYIHGLDAALNYEDQMMYDSHALGYGETLTSCPFVVQGNCDPDLYYPQQVAADVDGDGVLTPADAHSLWLVVANAMASGSTPGLPVTPFAWDMFCETKNLDMNIQYGTVLTGIADFVGVMKGDVNGNYNNGSTITAEKSLSTLQAPMISSASNSPTVTITLTNASSFNGGQFSLNFDSSVISVNNVRLASDLEGFTLHKTVQGNKLLVSVYSMTGDISANSVELIEFEATFLNDDVTARSSLVFESAIVRDGVPGFSSGYVTRDVVANENMSWGSLKADYR